MFIIPSLFSSVEQGPFPVSIKVDASRVIASVPRDTNGFSYESMQLTDPDFFSPSNKELVALFKALSPHGVLRLGGNSSELSWWKPTEDSKIPPEVEAASRRAGKWTNRTVYSISPRAIDNLAGFLKATGWTLIYGLNFGAGTPERDAEEAAYVAKKVGSRLKYFQIGNEPDLYTTADNGGRPNGWGFDDYVREWLAIADAVSTKVKSARFGGPDVASSSDWVVRFGQAVGPGLETRLACLSGHYYAMGPAGAKSSTIAHLLSRQNRVAETMTQVGEAAKKLGTTYRMTEGNSCYRGGQAGVSNALAGALWGADYILEMASHGGAGVNLHGGGGAHIGASLGDHLPGARNDDDLAEAKLGSFYSPIAGNRESGFTARPIFYGMLLAEQFAGSDMLWTKVEAGAANVNAYSAKTKKGILVAVINKDLKADANVVLKGVGAEKMEAWWLTGPSLEATKGITFGDSIVGPKNPWKPKTRVVPVATSEAPLLLPHGSAVLLLIR